MSQKIEFVERAKRGETVSALCREYGVSRQTGHKWMKRFREKGFEGLEDESRRPKSAPLATAEELVLSTVQARDEHPRWGPYKLHVLLRRRFGEQTPSLRTIARILQRANKVRERRKRNPTSVVERVPRVIAQAPNEVWTVDFKGWWRTLNGDRCEPLTVRDARSRFLLAVVACSTKKADVRPIFEQLFRKYGVPKAIQCDNGVPFISVQCRAGLSALSAWWVSLGIRVIRSRPGCPQDNGGHERMHSDVRADVQAHPAATRSEQQHVIDRWRQEFNHVRPHQALDGKTPAEVYRVTERRRALRVAYAYPSTSSPVGSTAAGGSRSAATSVAWARPWRISRSAWKSSTRCASACGFMISTSEWSRHSPALRTRASKGRGLLDMDVPLPPIVRADPSPPSPPPTPSCPPSERSLTTSSKIGSENKKRRHRLTVGSKQSVSDVLSRTARSAFFLVRPRTSSELPPTWEGLPPTWEDAHPTSDELPRSSTELPRDLGSASPDLGRSSQDLGRSSGDLCRASPDLYRPSGDVETSVLDLVRSTEVIVGASPDLGTASDDLDVASPDVRLTSPDLERASGDGERIPRGRRPTKKAGGGASQVVGGPSHDGFSLSRFLEEHPHDLDSPRRA